MGDARGIAKSEERMRLSVVNLLESYDPSNILGFRRLVFKGIEKDVYNITAPFIIGGKEYLAGRVESTNSEIDSKVMFFVREGDAWILDGQAPVFDLQDPFISFFGEQLIFGGVALSIVGENIGYRTVFFRGTGIHALKKFAEGPEGMKDIRLSLCSSPIGVFTRPQGAIGRRGRVGFMKLDALDHFEKLTSEDYYVARLLDDFFAEEEWLGVNAVYPLENAMLGILGHIAHFSSGHDKNYYPISFIFDPASHHFYDMKILARRIDLPAGRSKRPELKNVIFSGGLVRFSDGTAKLYAGAGDAEAYEITIKDPFN